jgi:hypothetical protein
MKKITEPLPENLQAILDSLDYEENGGLVITSLTYSGDDLIVFFKLACGDNESPEQLWRLDVVGLEKEKVVRSWTLYPEIYTDHFLLWEYTDYYTELYYKGQVDNPEKLFRDLYKTYVGNFDDNFKFGFGINAPNGMLKLCTDDIGLFARGPKRLLAEYEKCLIGHGIKTNYVNEIKPEAKDLKLLLFGDSYFIGKEFKFQLSQEE